MAIAFVNGATNASSTGVTTLTTTYSPTAGNTVLVFVACAATVTNMVVTDNRGNPLAPGPTLGAGAFYSFYYTAATGVTGFGATWTTSRAVAMGVVEYSGVVGGVNANLAGNTATSTSTTASITVTTEDNNDFIVGVLLSTNIITTTVGNAREANNVAGVKLNISDNTVATAGSISLTGTLTSAQWFIIVLELRSVLVQGIGSTSNWLTKAVATGVNKH